MVEDVLRLLTSSNWRKGSLGQCDFPLLAEELRARLSTRVRAGAPIALTLMAFPFKVPNPAKAGTRRLPDLAELAAIRRLATLARNVRTVYSPGLRLHLIHDGALIGPAFGVTLEETRAYEAYFGNMVATEAPDGSIQLHDFGQLQRAAGLRAEAALDRLRDEAIRWWRMYRGTPTWQERFRKTLGMLNVRDLPVGAAAALLAAGRGGFLPPKFSEIERRVHRAMITYHALDAMIHQLDPRPLLFPDAIHATTRVQPGRLALWLVRRGNALLPWHGVGVLDARGQAGVALAERVQGRSDLEPVMLPGESSPFCFVGVGCRNGPGKLQPAGGAGTL